MNVACTACPAKYAVPDDKVRGRKVKITCKHCGTAIVVDGTKLAGAAGTASVAPAATASVVPAQASLVPVVTEPGRDAAAAKATRAEAPAAKLAESAARPAPAPEPEPPAPEAEIEWLVAFSDDRQDPATTAQVVELYASGHIDEGTYVWREGMDDWAAPFEIPELAAALTAAGILRRSAPPPPFVGDEDEPTRMVSSPIANDAATTTSGVWREPGRPNAPRGESPEKLPFERQSATPPAESPAPAAATARKSERPRAAKAESTTRAARAEPAARAAKIEAAARHATKAEPAARAATRAAASARRREETSAVDDLFGSVAKAGSEEDASLHASTAPDAPRMTGQRNESSVLFSLDALIKTEKSAAAKPSARKKDDEAAILFGEPAPNSIANVGTGGIGVALAAPDFTAPVAAPPPSAPRAASFELAAAPPPKKRGMGLLVAVLVLGGGAGIAFALGVPQKLMAPPAPVPTPQAEPAAAAKPVETTPATATTEPTSTASASAATAPSGAPTQPAAAKPGEAKPAEAKPGEARPPGESKPAEKPAPKEEPAAGGGDLPPFDKAAAAAALGAAAANASSCRQPGGAMGGGRVTVTFAPSGRATNTNVTGEVAGTTVGGCVARLFRSVKVPPFSGEPITVGKSFSIE